MANDLISTNWVPPQARQVNSLMKWGMLAAMALGGLYLFNVIAPTAVDALKLMDLIFQNMAHMAVSGLIAFTTLWAVYSALTPTGTINKLIRLPWWAFVNWLTRVFITIDPMSPINERIKKVQDNKATVDASRSKVSGVVSKLKEKEADFRDRSNVAKNKAISAHNRGSDFKIAEDTQTRAFGTFRDTADKLAKMRQRLEPVLIQLSGVSQACDIMVQNLQNEREQLSAMWEAQQAVGEAVSTANKALGISRSVEWDMAEQAEQIISSKYGEELGHLDELTRQTEPLMQSMDLDTASYSEELFSNVEKSAATVVQMTNALPSPTPYHTQSTLAQPTEVLSGLIR